MKKVVVISWLVIVFAGVSFLFWKNEWIYNLPTPVPEGLKIVNTGKKLQLHIAANPDKPLFLHFFNPNCPCSRFNMTHFKSLVDEYGDRVDFRIVVISNRSFTEKEIQNKYDLFIPVSFDASIADSCGVYSTPQAVILGNDQRLYYRGNYNKTRYCADKKTEYARMALASLLKHEQTLSFDKFALRAYGCKLTTCDKK